MLGNRLLLARKKAGLSMDALVESMGGLVTKQSLSKYERDLMMPSSNVLTKLSECLDVTLEFLFNSEIISLEGIDFRTESTTTAKDRAKVEAVVIEHLERYLAVEEIVEENVHSFNEKTKTIYNEDDIEAFCSRDERALGSWRRPNSKHNCSIRRKRLKGSIIRTSFKSIWSNLFLCIVEIEKIQYLLLLQTDYKL